MTGRNEDRMPDINSTEVMLAFRALCMAMDREAKARGVTLCDVAVVWHQQHGGRGGFNCIFSEGLTPDVAEGMAGVLIMDSEDADFSEAIELPGVQ